MSVYAKWLQSFFSPSVMGGALGLARLMLCRLSCWNSASFANQFSSSSHAVCLWWCKGSPQKPMGQWVRLFKWGGCMHTLAAPTILLQWIHGKWPSLQIHIGFALLTVASTNNLESKELECSTVPITHLLLWNKMTWEQSLFEDFICGCPSMTSGRRASLLILLFTFYQLSAL